MTGDANLLESQFLHHAAASFVAVEVPDADPSRAKAAERVTNSGVCGLRRHALSGVFPRHPISLGNTPKPNDLRAKALEIFPKYWLAHVELALIYIAQGRSREAIGAAQSAREDEPLADWTTAVLGMAYAADGQRTQAEKLLADLNAKAAREWVPSYALAEIYAGLHDKPHTLAALEKTYQERAWFLTFLNAASEFDFLRAEARFQDLLRKMNFPH